MHHIMAKFWWILVVRGALGILLGITSLFWIWDLNRPSLDVFGLSIFLRPAAIVGTLVVMLGLYAFLDGLFAIVLGAQDYGDGRRWKSLVAEGLFSIALGVAAWMKPEVAVLTLLYWIAAWALATGLMEISQATDLNEYPDRKISLFLAGLCSLGYGLLVLYFRVGGGGLLWATSAYAFFFGFSLLVLGMHLRGFAQKAK